MLTLRTHKIKSDINSVAPCRMLAVILPENESTDEAATALRGTFACVYVCECACVFG
jgi:hypothetical protein